MLSVNWVVFFCFINFSIPTPLPRARALWPIQTSSDVWIDSVYATAIQLKSEAWGWCNGGGSDADYDDGGGDDGDGGGDGDDDD